MGKQKISAIQKLSIAIGALMVLMLGMAVGSLVAARTQSALLERAVTQNGGTILAVSEIQLAVAELRAAQRGLLLFTVLKNTAVAARAHESFRRNAGLIRTNAARVRTLMTQPEGRQALETIEKRLSDWEPVYGRIAAKTQAGEIDDELNRLVDETVVNYAPMLESAGKLAEMLRAAQDRAVAEAASTRDWSLASTAGLLLLCLVACSAVGWVVRNVGRKLSHVAQVVGDGAERLTAASGQISESSSETARAASEQAGMISQTSESTERIRRMVRSNAEHAQDAAAGMTQAAGEIERAEAVLAEMKGSMNEIANSSGRISRIIRVIDEIAFQTNILALNAAVEAARAGEAGQGFAVVAEEVRSLAQRSAQAAKDTAALIEESIAKSREGHRDVEGVASAVRAMTDSALRVKTLVESVKTGSEDQARGIDLVARAVVQLEATTQATAASAEQSAAASSELNDQAARLEEAVIELNEMVGRR